MSLDNLQISLSVHVVPCVSLLKTEILSHFQVVTVVLEFTSLQGILQWHQKVICGDAHFYIFKDIEHCQLRESKPPETQHEKASVGLGQL